MILLTLNEFNVLYTPLLHITCSSYHNINLIVANHSYLCVVAINRETFNFYFVWPPRRGLHMGYSLFFHGQMDTFWILQKSKNQKTKFHTKYPLFCFNTTNLYCEGLPLIALQLIYQIDYAILIYLYHK